MKTMIQNLINGNLSDAKRRDKRFGLYKIYIFARGYFPIKKAAAAAMYLKYPSQRTWDAFCNAPNSHFA